MTRVALLQLTSSDDPEENIASTLDMIARAADQAEFIVTPEVTNCVSASRDRQREVLRSESADPTLRAIRAAAIHSKKWVLIGSLALKSDDPKGRFVNRSFLIGPDGAIAAKYDKVHMFDVAVSETETYRESSGYRPGSDLAIGVTPFAHVGLTICYDLRFPYVFRQLSKAGAQIITVPSAFSPATGAAHWETLLRARAIETGCFILAPAQTGTHTAVLGRARKTYGHSLAVAPWGDILIDAGTEPGHVVLEIDIGAVEQARSRIPSLTHDRSFEGA